MRLTLPQIKKSPTTGRSMRRASALLAAGALTTAALVASPASPAAAWNGLTIDGPVNSAVVGDDGSVFVGGLFQNVGGQARQSLVKFSPDGSVDTAFNANITQGQVEKVVLDDTHVYVGGQWEGVSNDTQYQRLARFDRATGEVDNTWVPGNIVGTGASVNDIDIVGDDVYATGGWIGFAGTSRKIAKLTKTTASADPHWGPVLTGTSNDSGAALVVDGDTMYLAGQFNFVDDVESPGLAALNTSDGSRKDGFNANMNSNAIASELVQVGSQLFFGGQITTVDGTARNNLAAVDASTGALAGWNPAPAAPANVFVSAMAADASGNVYVGGFFTSMGTNSKTVSNVAALNSSTGQALGWNPMVTGGPVFGLDIFGTGASTKVYVSGIYSDIAGSQTPTNGAAAPLLSPNGNGRFNVLAGANVVIPPQATSVGLDSNTLSWTDPWLGGQQYAWVLYKRSSDPDVMRSWKVFAFGNTNGGIGQTPSSLTISASCPSGWTCPRPIGFQSGTSYDFNVIMRSYDGKNSAGPNTARATYTAP